jgi:hypothetical protein
MKHQPHQLTFLNPLSGDPARLPVAPGLDGRRVGSVWRHPAVLPGLAVVLVVGLLLVFHAVATQAVNQSVLRQQARSVQSQALWHCKLLSQVAARRDCLRDLAAPMANGM